MGITRISRNWKYGDIQYLEYGDTQYWEYEDIRYRKYMDIHCLDYRDIQYWENGVQYKEGWNLPKVHISSSKPSPKTSIWENANQYVTKDSSPQKRSLYIEILEFWGSGRDPLAHASTYIIFLATAPKTYQSSRVDKPNRLKCQLQRTICTSQ